MYSDIGVLLAEISDKWVILKEMKNNIAFSEDDTGSFYMNEILPLLCERFRTEERSKLKQMYDIMILSVGMSVEPLILSLSAVQPKKIFFLYTIETEMKIDFIVEFLKLKPSQYEKALVDRVDSSRIYKVIRDFVHSVSLSSIAVDFTGGTKAMSAGTAMAAAVIGADIIYISSRYSPDHSMVEPGSEQLNRVANPYEVFGDMEANQAAQFWIEAEYNAAAEVYERLSVRVPVNNEYKVFARMARAYDAWHLFQMTEVQVHLEWVLTEGSDILKWAPAQRVNSDQFDIIRRQKEIAGKLANHVGGQQVDLEVLADAEKMHHLILLLFATGRQFGKRSKWGLGSLHMYRTIEMVFQHRMATFGIRTDQPDYGVLDVTSEELLKRVNDCLLNHKLGSQRWGSLPSQLSLANTHVLLIALGDSLAMKTNIGKIRGGLDARNHHYLIHGYLNIENSNYAKMEETATELVRRMIEGSERNLEEALTVYEGVKPSFD